MMKQKEIKKYMMYVFLILFGYIMVYPLLWLFFASFKSDIEIFASSSLLPTNWVFNAYKDGWQIFGGRYTYTQFYINTFVMVIPTVILTLISSILVAFGFARYEFPLKRFLFILVLSGLLLPNEILMVPRYLMFHSMDWIDTYLPFYIPAAFATYPFFIYMFIQFFRCIPRELDESARIDGCHSFGILIRIILPLSSAPIFTAAIFQFLWRWNDFYNPLVYISTFSKYPVSLVLRSFLDVTDRIFWNRALAMSMISLLPPVFIFAFFQRYLLEGIATTGLKC